MNEELISANGQPVDPRQQHLVQTYCAGIEEKLRLAQSDHEATKIIEAVCGKFDAACESEVLRLTLRSYLGSLVSKVKKERKEAKH